MYHMTKINSKTLLNGGHCMRLSPPRPPACLPACCPPGVSQFLAGCCLTSPLLRSMMARTHSGLSFVYLFIYLHIYIYIMTCHKANWLGITSENFCVVTTCSTVKLIVRLIRHCWDSWLHGRRLPVSDAIILHPRQPNKKDRHSPIQITILIEKGHPTTLKFVMNWSLFFPYIDIFGESYGLWNKTALM